MKELSKIFSLYIKQLNFKTIMFYLVFILFILIITISSFFHSDPKVESEIDSSPPDSTTTEIYAQITGAVVNPGVYQLEDGARLFDLIELAGGFENANTTCINQAKIITDEENIYIPNKDEECQGEQESGLSTEEPLVNINTASKEELMTLPSIGETRADDIIAYRDLNGGFTSTSDLQNISGIGDSTYAEIEPLVSV